MVKLFGCFPSWRSDFAAELAAQRLLRDRPELPAPPLLAHGSLYDGGPEPWPYLVTGRVGGVALRDTRLSPRQRRVLAARLGQVVYGGAKCLDAYEAGTTNTTVVGTYNCNGQANQQWIFHADGTIGGTQSGLCLDVNMSTNRVQLYSCWGGDNQRWQVS